VRNRLRRVLRVLLVEADSTEPLPSGLYLFGARPAAVLKSRSELQFDLELLLRRVRD